MGIWAGIKHALNSTLGTSNFKPLDKMINDLIVEQTRMVASDNLYASLENITLELSGNQTVDYDFPQKLKMTRYGTMKILGDISRTQVSNQYFSFSIYKNNENIYKLSKSYSEGDSTESFSTSISFEPDDIIEFRLLTANSSALERTLKLSNFGMYGTIKDNVFLETE